MPKTFKKSSPIKYRQILKMAEKIIMINNADEQNLVLNDLYKIIHPFVGSCDNPHWDWREFADETERKLSNY